METRWFIPARIQNGGSAFVRAAVPHMRELAIVMGAYWVYMYSRAMVFDDFESTAITNAKSIISFEESLGFFWEPHWQAWAIDSAKSLVIFFNWAYIVTFLPILLTTGFILYLVNRRRYLYYRNLILVSFIVALIGFMLFPLAPPRMMAEHFVDTIKAFGPAFYASRELASYYNPYAAMPSLHFSWTLMLGNLFLRTPGKWFKVAGVLYPTMTLLAITITGNHYIMDAVGGCILIVLTFAVVELGFKRRLFLSKLLGTAGFRPKTD